jgi:Flp pilus assembly protein TadD
MYSPHEKWIKAQELLIARKLNEALVLLNEALEVEPHNANFISERAVVYFHLGDKNLALLELDRAVALEPNNPYRYSSRAYIKSSMKMTKGAILDYEKCVQLDPDDAVAYNNLGILLEAAGKIEAAKRHFKKADELEGILNERGITLQDAENNLVKSEASSGKKINKEKNEESIEKTRSSFWETVKGVFTNKSIFKEYIKFIKSGFKVN